MKWLSWLLVWPHKKVAVSLVDTAAAFEKKYGTILEYRKPWAPGEPAQSILRAMIRNRRRFVTQMDYAGASTIYTALDVETGRTFWLRCYYSGRRGSSADCSDGLSVKEALWIKDTYVEYRRALVARADRIRTARARSDIMREYVK